MQEKSSRLPDIDVPIQRALLHSKRTKILGYLMQKRDGTGASEEEIAAALRIGDRIVEYHLKVLQDADLIARFDGERAPGTGRSYVWHQAR